MVDFDIFGGELSEHEDLKLAKSKFREELPKAEECVSITDMIKLVHLAISCEPPTSEQTERALSRLAMKYGEGVRDI